MGSLPKSPTYRYFLAALRTYISAERGRQTAVALAAGVTHGALSNIKTGRNGTDVDTMEALARACGAKDLFDFIARGRALLAPSGAAEMNSLEEPPPSAIKKIWDRCRYPLCRDHVHLLDPLAVLKELDPKEYDRISIRIEEVAEYLRSRQAWPSFAAPVAPRSQPKKR